MGCHELHTPSISGANHSLALGLDHVTVWGWGSNEHGQLGPDVLDGTSSPQVLSLRLSPEETIVRIDAGYAHSAVLTSRYARNLIHHFATFHTAHCTLLWLRFLCLYQRQSCTVRSWRERPVRNWNCGGRNHSGHSYETSNLTLRVDGYK
eukprot:COSAG02_NODE_6276_length_3686_cov_2.296627_3_plen_150_part_00